MSKPSPTSPSAPAPPPTPAPAAVSGIDLTFPHHWKAEILPARPAILPTRHYVYPRDAEEVERGALEVFIRTRPATVHCPSAPGQALSPEQALYDLQPASGHDFSRAENPGQRNTGTSAPAKNPIPQTGAFLATCALGFRDPAIPSGLWSCPNPEEICAISGGYAYIIRTTAPDRFTMLPYRPVLEIRPLPSQNLLLFVSNRDLLAWGIEGQLWQSDKLSDEGITITSIESNILHGLGWHLLTDKETPFAIDLRTGRAAPPRTLDFHPD